ncbi:uncharacterized protein EDB91DRAFT_1065341 [Suillus paluster]|uniref:uncharacterized protein n=1 Tax=Suillus paluster TaxID=48578 RepID=UPI001B85D18E|nr:uncharacterized protein EDB91DRAFT_1065341 [Suillus paluster]KAG1719766.1 hypothetical protein EDB91DRAFT_1065341 [Suillus paluster]
MQNEHFPAGRLQVNHLQHGISSQAFKAQMAIGSWYKTPFLDDKIATRILSESMKRGKKGKGKARQDAGSDHDRDNVVELDSD